MCLKDPRWLNVLLEWLRRTINRSYGSCTTRFFERTDSHSTARASARHSSTAHCRDVVIILERPVGELCHRPPNVPTPCRPSPVSLPRTAQPTVCIARRRSDTHGFHRQMREQGRTVAERRVRWIRGLDGRESPLRTQRTSVGELSECSAQGGELPSVRRLTVCEPT